MARDFELNPYDRSEALAAKYIQEASGGKIGGGDDPIEFLISMHANMILERRAIVGATKALTDETIYEGGRLMNGISSRFLKRLALLKEAAGLIHPDDFVSTALAKEAKVFFDAEKNKLT